MLEPDIIILATGGLPDLAWLDGAEHCLSVWDVLTGQTRPNPRMLVYDGTGDHQALSCADYLTSKGCEVTLVTPDTMLGQNMGVLERVIYRKRFYELGIDIICDQRLAKVKPDGNGLKASFINELTGAESEHLTGQVVVEHGTVPVDELYLALREDSRNDGVTDITSLIAKQPQPEGVNPEGRFELYRIGDAISSRNIHMAIFDAFRLCCTL